MAALLSVLALGFSPVPRSSALSLGDAVVANRARATTPTLSFFDDLKRGMAEARMMATVQHVLVDDRAKCEALKAQIATDGIETFGEVAKEHSSCPSAKKGGIIGPFGKGQMVPEFEAVAFRQELGEVHGPVETKFGYHLVLINKRKTV